MTEALHHCRNANAHSMRGKIRKYATAIRLYFSPGRLSFVSLLLSFLYLSFYPPPIYFSLFLLLPYFPNLGILASTSKPHIASLSTHM